MTRCSNSPSRNTILVIHDPPLDPEDILHVQLPFFLCLNFSYSDIFIHVCLLSLKKKKKALPIVLPPQALTQYSADKDGAEERLGKDVEGNDNAQAEFIH